MYKYNDLQKVFNLIIKILLKNTSLNVYVSKDCYEILNGVIVAIHGKYKSPINTRLVTNKTKFYSECQYNIEFSCQQSNIDKIEIKKHYNFSQNHIKINFIYSDYHNLFYINEILWPQFKQYQI